MRKIDFNTEKHFECGGKEFFVNDSLSFTRYKELTKISLEFGFSTSFQDIFNNIRKGIEHYNKHNYFDMSIVLYKILEGIKNTEEKDDPALRICALFINEKDEDPTKYNESEMKAKIECWGRELAIDPFFYLAASLVPAWMPAYEMLIRGGLSQPEKENK